MREITIPINDEIIRSLKVGEPVTLTGVMITGRDVVHKWLIETFIKKTRPPQGEDMQVYAALQPILAGGVRADGPGSARAGGNRARPACERRNAA